MADADLTEYERLRAENIRRNEVILASVRRNADELSAAIKASDPRSVLRRKADELPAAIKTSDPRSVLRRSLRLSQPPPDAHPAPPAPNPTPSRRRAPRKPKRRRRAPRRTTPGTAKPRSTTFSSSLASTILEAVSLSPGAAKLRADDFDAGKELVLTPANVRTLLPSRILGLLVLPLVDRTMVAAGDNLGNIGFWHADPELGAVEADRVFEYLPHIGPVAAIVAHPAMPHKIYSCSYKGEICLMDLEKENFNIIYSCQSPVISLCQAPDSASCIYVGDGTGELKLFDERMGKVSATWESHDNRINSIDFHPEKNI
uniref:Uncharacterized protein n=1 Tax=Avena sativa TaxID=4498 RepID=A0ACD5X5D4_AVESA